MNFRPTELVVHRDHLIKNFQILRGMTKAPFFCPMVKANAYGHGACDVARLIDKQGGRQVGVALYEEAIQLREAVIRDLQILVFGQLTDGALKLVIDHNLTPVIGSEKDLQILRSAGSGLRGLTVHLKVNVGMNRLGFSISECKKIFDFLTHNLGTKVEGLCCHLATAEDIGGPGERTRDQLDQFIRCGRFLGIDHLHALNSEALTKLHQLQDPRLDVLGARPGIALYGIGGFGLRPAMSLNSKIVHLQKVKRGESVSYGARWIAPQDSLIGVIPVGYADGVRRGLSGKLKVLIDGASVPSVGTICMDYLMVDLTHLYQNQGHPLGQDVKLLSPEATGHTVIDWAKDLSTIPYEIMTGFGSRMSLVHQ